MQRIHTYICIINAIISTDGIRCVAHICFEIGNSFLEENYASRKRFVFTFGTETGIIEMSVVNFGSYSLTKKYFALTLSTD